MQCPHGEDGTDNGRGDAASGYFDPERCFGVVQIFSGYPFGTRACVKWETGAPAQFETCLFVAQRMRYLRNMSRRDPPSIGNREAGARRQRIGRTARSLGFRGRVEYRHVYSQTGGAQFCLGPSIDADLLVVYAEAFERDRGLEGDRRPRFCRIDSGGSYSNH